jgi:hypothetical protein
LHFVKSEFDFRLPQTVLSLELRIRQQTKIYLDQGNKPIWVFSSASLAALHGRLVIV